MIVGAYAEGNASPRFQTEALVKSGSGGQKGEDQGRNHDCTPTSSVLQNVWYQGFPTCYIAPLEMLRTKRVEGRGHKSGSQDRRADHLLQLSWFENQPDNRYGSPLSGAVRANDQLTIQLAILKWTGCDPSENWIALGSGLPQMKEGGQAIKAR
jgi:hypothetical protein